MDSSVFARDKGEWRVPAERMKMREHHIVPLSRQAVEILWELEPLTNRSMPSRPNAPCYVFPSARTRERPVSENAILAALRRMGYTKEEMTGHGFRSMASILLHEQGWNQSGHRAPARPRRAQRRERGLQFRRALTGATKDDAGLGGLS